MVKSISSNWLLTLLQIGVAFVLMPFTIHVLGEDKYGAWVLVSSVTGYLGMMALGIPMATVRFVARDTPAGRQDALNRTVSTCAGIYLLVGLASTLVGTALFVVWDRVYDLSPALRTEARWAFAIAVLNLSASFIGQLPYGIMSAYQDFVTRNNVMMASLGIRLGLTYGLLSLQASLVWLAVIQVVCFVFEFAVATAIARRRYPAIRVRFSDFSVPMVREILTFSTYVVVLQAGIQLVFQSDALVIGKFLPIGEIPFFTVSSQLAIYLMSFVLSVGAVIMPTAATMQTQGRLSELRDVFLRWSKIIVWLCCISCLSLSVLGPPFIGWWIGPEYEMRGAAVLQSLMLANLVFLPARGVALPLLMGLGKPRRPTVAFLVTGIINLALSVALVRPLGIFGVALGTAIPNVVFGLGIVALACRELEVPLAAYARYCLGRAALGSLPLIALLLWLRHGLGVRGLFGVAAAGLVTLGLGGVIAVVYVFRGDERVGLDQRIVALRGRWFA